MDDTTQQPDNARTPATERPPLPRPRPDGHGARNLVLVLLAVVVLGGAVVYVGYGDQALLYLKQIGRFFFEPIALVFLFAMALEYLTLKSADRSRLLRIELEKLRAKRRAEVTALRKTHETLRALKKDLDQGGVDMPRVEEDVDRMLEFLRPPEARLVESAGAKTTKPQPPTE